MRHIWDEIKLDEEILPDRRYVTCYCDKHAKVLVGQTLYGYLNAIAGFPSIVLITGLYIYGVIRGAPLWPTAFILLIPVIAVPLIISYYRSGKRMMQKADHAKKCSRKIGLLVALHGGGYSDIVIMKNINKEKDDNGKISPLK